VLSLITLVIIVNGTLGKFVACWLAARAVGKNRQVSLGLGTLMNARVLIDRILLNIGLDRGVVTPTLFTMVVIMALVTTWMATPIFNLVYGRSSQHLSEHKDTNVEGKISPSCLEPQAVSLV
jgi:Kef-type K+ transport system membrane component KefB